MPSAPDSGATDDGWTRVGGGKRTRLPPGDPGTVLPPWYPAKYPPPDRTMTVLTLQTMYEKSLIRWRASSYRKEFQQILDKKQPDGGWQITDAVCLASGSFAREDGGTRHRYRCMSQLAAFMDTVEHVRKSSNGPIKLYAEEVIYTDVDIAFLTNLGIEVRSHEKLHERLLNDPSPWCLPGKQPMVFELYMEPHAQALRQILRSDPKLFVGSQPAKKITGLVMGYTDEEDRILAEAWTAARTFYVMPRCEDEDESPFYDLWIYWKEPVDEEDET